jgi:hypothetical protein
MGTALGTKPAESVVSKPHSGTSYRPSLRVSGLRKGPSKPGVAGSSPAGGIAKHKADRERHLERPAAPSLGIGDQGGDRGDVPERDEPLQDLASLEVIVEERSRHALDDRKLRLLAGVWR